MGWDRNGIGRLSLVICILIISFEIHVPTIMSTKPDKIMGLYSITKKSTSLPELEGGVYLMPESIPFFFTQVMCFLLPCCPCCLLCPFATFQYLLGYFNVSLFF